MFTPQLPLGQRFPVTDGATARARQWPSASSPQPAARSRARTSGALTLIQHFGSAANLNSTLVGNSAIMNIDPIFALGLAWAVLRGAVPEDQQCFHFFGPAVIPAISDGIASIRRLGHGVLMAESNVHHIPDYADRLYVLERGEILYAGKPGDSFPAEVMRAIGTNV